MDIWAYLDERACDCPKPLLPIEIESAVNKEHAAIHNQKELSLNRLSVKRRNKHRIKRVNKTKPAIRAVRSSQNSAPPVKVKK